MDHDRDSGSRHAPALHTSEPLAAARQPLDAVRRACFILLCVGPLVILPLAGLRGLRRPGVSHAVGAVLFAALSLCAWRLSMPSGQSRPGGQPRVRVAGALLLAPLALIALLWVGLGPPWGATPPENAMRYAVLLAGSIAVTCGFWLCAGVLRDAAAGVASDLGQATNLLAGAGYLVWTSLQLGMHTMLAATGQVPEPVAAVSNAFDVLLFAAGVLAYVTTALIAHGFGRIRWLSRRAASVYVVASLIAVVLLMLRGVSFPSPAAGPEPWYTQPGFVVGIPAIPWVMPFLLGVVALRRAGDGGPSPVHEA